MQKERNWVHEGNGHRLRALGFYLNPGKTKWLPADRRQLVTGIVVNKKCNVPSEERRALRQELHFCQKFGISGHMARAGIDGPEDRYLAQLLGRSTTSCRSRREGGSCRKPGTG